MPFSLQPHTSNTASRLNQSARSRRKFADPADNRQNENKTKGHGRELRHTQTG